MTSAVTRPDAAGQARPAAPPAAEPVPPSGGRPSGLAPLLPFTPGTLRAEP